MNSNKSKMIFLGKVEVDITESRRTIVLLDKPNKLPRFGSRVFTRKMDDYSFFGKIKDIIGPVKNPWVIISKNTNSQIEAGTEVYFNWTKKKSKGRTGKRYSN
ncbi:MAG: H/ACA ribonucleoprotein complex subunit GAR1 [Candidatus Hodarchaeales archaeon]